MQPTNTSAAGPEPFARSVVGPPIRTAQVRWLEIAAGAVLGAVLLAAAKAA